MDAEGFSELVADVYDAALDPPSWRKVLKDICAFVRGGPAASLFWQDAVKRTGKTCYAWGGDPVYDRLYWDKYVGLNPFTAAAGHFPVESIYSAADILPLPRVLRDAVLQGMDDAAGLGRRALGHAGQVGHQPCGVHGRAARPRRAGRRRHALAHAPAGAACAALRDDRQAGQSQERRGRRDGRHARRAAGRHVPGRRRRAADARQCERARDAERRQFAARQRQAGRARCARRRGAARHSARRRQRRRRARRQGRHRAADRARRRAVSSPTCCRSPRARGGAPDNAMRRSPRCSCRRRATTPRRRWKC